MNTPRNAKLNYVIVLVSTKGVILFFVTLPVNYRGDILINLKGGAIWND